MNDEPEQPLPQFRLIEPLAGFIPATRSDPAPSFTPFFFSVPEESLVLDESDNISEAAARCTVRRLAVNRW